MTIDYAEAKFHKGGGTKITHGQQCWYSCKNRRKFKASKETGKTILCNGAVKFRLVRMKNKIVIDPNRYLIDYRAHDQLCEYSKTNSLLKSLYEKRDDNKETIDSSDFSESESSSEESTFDCTTDESDTNESGTNESGTNESDTNDQIQNNNSFNQNLHVLDVTLDTMADLSSKINCKSLFANKLKECQKSFDSLARKFGICCDSKGLDWTSQKKKKIDRSRLPSRRKSENSLSSSADSSIVDSKPLVQKKARKATVHSNSFLSRINYERKINERVLNKKSTQSIEKDRIVQQKKQTPSDHQIEVTEQFQSQLKSGLTNFKIPKKNL